MENNGTGVDCTLHPRVVLGSSPHILATSVASSGSARLFQRRLPSTKKTGAVSRPGATPSFNFPGSMILIYMSTSFSGQAMNSRQSPRLVRRDHVCDVRAGKIAGPSPVRIPMKAARKLAPGPWGRPRVFGRAAGVCVAQPATVVLPVHGVVRGISAKPQAPAPPFRLRPRYMGLSIGFRLTHWFRSRYMGSSADFAAGHADIADDRLSPPR